MPYPLKVQLTQIQNSNEQRNNYWISFHSEMFLSVLTPVHLLFLLHVFTQSWSKLTAIVHFLFATRQLRNIPVAFLVLLFLDNIGHEFFHLPEEAKPTLVRWKCFFGFFFVLVFFGVGGMSKTAAIDNNENVTMVYTRLSINKYVFFSKCWTTSINSLSKKVFFYRTRTNDSVFFLIQTQIVNYLE